MTAPAPPRPAPPRPDPSPSGPSPSGPSRHRATADLPTAALVRAACAGDPWAWAELVDRYEGLVHGVVVSYRMGDADVADAVQNTWVRALERLGSVRDPERLGGWLATTARRECLALLRRQAREVADGLLDDDMPALGPGPEAEALTQEVHRVVRRAVAELPQRRRALVTELFGVSDTDYATIARRLDVPPGSIGPTRGRVLRALRGTLERGGFDAESVA